jgi:hypothetical protein
MKRILLFTATISALIVFGFYKYKIGLTDIVNFKDLLNATISIGSIGVGFLAAAITLLPSQQNNSFLLTRTAIGGYNKLLNSLLIGIAVLFTTCLLSVIGLFINLEVISKIGKVFFYIWLFSFVMTMSSVIYVIGVFMYYLKSASSNTN